MFKFITIAIAVTLCLQHALAAPKPGNISDAAENVDVPPEHRAVAPQAPQAPPAPVQPPYHVVQFQPAFVPFASSFTGHTVQHHAVYPAAPFKEMTAATAPQIAVDPALDYPHYFI